MNTPKEVLKPRDDIAFIAKTLPNSLIAIHGIDQSLTFLGTENLITQAKLDEKLSIDSDNYKFELSKSQRLFGKVNAFILSPTRKKRHICTMFEEDILSKEVKIHVGGSRDQTFITKPIVKSPVRRFFPEVWFNEVMETTNGEFEYRNSTPDSITNWMISGFSINQDAGFAVAEPQIISVFQDFFIKVEKPQLVKLSEIVNLKVIIFNYMPSEAKTTIKFNNINDQFNFMTGSQIDNDLTKLVDIQVKSNKTAAINFSIRPKISGKIYLNIDATTSTGKNDHIEESFEVEQFGRSMHQTKARMINLKDNKTFEDVFVFENLSNALENSIIFEVDASTDLIGPALNNVENLM